MSHYVIPGGGLCNRLRVIKSITELAIDQNSQIKILWRVNSELGSTYQSLFKYKEYDDKKFDVINIHRLHPLYWILHPKLLKIYKNIVSYLPINISIFLPEETKFPVNSSIMTPGKKIIHSYHKFAKFQDMNDFLPVNNIQKLIDKTLANFNAYTIGIHIRRTDNQEAIRMSPLSLFISRIEELIVENSSYNFFLCTDDPDVKKELLNKFPDKIQTRDILYNRGNRKAIEDAVIDLYLLANTHQMLCSHYSSFSETAILLGCKSKKVEIVQISSDKVKSQAI